MVHSRVTGIGIQVATIAARRSAALILLAGIATTAATAQGFEWRQGLGTNGPDGTVSIAPDGSGGILVSGYTWGNLVGTNAGLLDGWVARYTPAGSQMWIRQIGSWDYDSLSSSAADGQQGVFVGGSSSGPMGGSNTGDGDGWLFHFDGSGNLLWSTQIGTSSTGDALQSMAPDATGGVIVCGITDGNLGGHYAGKIDAWIARFDAAGNQLWIRQFGTSDTELAWGVVEHFGSVYACGMTFGSSNDHQIWLSRFDLDGNRLWFRKFGTSGSDEARYVAGDGAGGVYVSGVTSGALGGPALGYDDVWLARFDSSGNQLWVRQLGSNVQENGGVLAQDGTGGVYVCGESEFSVSKADVWVARFDGSGSMLWWHHFGTGFDDGMRAACWDLSSGLFLGGDTFAEIIRGATNDNDAWFGRYNVP